jgi:hypothetical protein
MNDNILGGAVLAFTLILILFVITGKIDFLNYKEDIFIIWNFLLDRADELNGLFDNFTDYMRGE